MNNGAWGMNVGMGDEEERIKRILGHGHRPPALALSHAWMPLLPLISMACLLAEFFNSIWQRRG
jgi:hypothetical protein